VNLKKKMSIGTDFEVMIPVKINLHQILMLASIKYLPSFCGRWEIELYPNWNNLVVLPCCPVGELTSELEAGEIHNALTEFRKITKSFTQLGQPFNFWGNITAAASWTGPSMAATITALDDVVLNCTSGKLDVCLMNLTTFQLRFEVFEGLRDMYSQQALIIPTNVMHYSRFSGQPDKNTADTVFHATLSQSLENCDSVFILVPNNTAQTTCFYQPWLKEVRLSLGEFGVHPQRSVKTSDEPRFIAKF
jgi:hypothetical protein